jgi:2,4-dienoyl-CoA reductase-like NADH-dependent reductase (Old Yellow Enzyme family)
MGKHQQFKVQSLQDFQDMIQSLGLNIPVSQDMEVLKKPISVGTKSLPNALAIHPMEGCDGTSDGKPDFLTFRRYDRFSRGGAGLIWVEAVAVVHEGRANPRQLFICNENLDAFQRLYDNIIQSSREEYGEIFRPYTVVQLTHSGRYSNPEGSYSPVIAEHNPYLDKNIPKDYPVISDDELEKLEDEFVKAAKLAKTIGFDAVDIKSCHRYLNNELLSAFTRKGRYGGSFENRSRFLLNIVDKIQNELGNSIDITLRMNVYDAIPYPYGWGVDKDDLHKPDLSEPIRLIRILSKKGIKMINISSGNPYYNPHVGRPYDTGPYIPPEHPLIAVARMLDMTRQIQQSVPDMVVAATGFSWMREFAANIAAGCIKDGWFKAAGFGRQAFAYPDFARDILEKGVMERKKCCITCGKCSEIMRDGGCTGCVPKDAEVYVPIYQEGRKGKNSLVGKHIAEHV